MSSPRTSPSPTNTISPTNGTLIDIASSKHVVIFPFMSKGHTIPLVHLSHLFSQHGLALTFFSTPANSPFLHSSLGATPAAIVNLPFPEHVPGIPPGVESTDKLPSMDLILPFMQATKLLRPHFEKALRTLHPPVTCIIYDGFLTWAQASASELNVPGLVFYGMNTFAMVMYHLMLMHKPHRHVSHANEPFSVPEFDQIKLCKRDFNEPFSEPDPKGPQWDFIVESGSFLSGSGGVIMNSFYELEPAFVDFYNRTFGPKAAWCVGPLCAGSPSTGFERLGETASWEQWLDHMQTMRRPVLYVAFGSQARISEAQLREIAAGLEMSGVGFLWVVRVEEAQLGDGFEERVKERGLVVRGWLDQRRVLGHAAVKGFLSHCGWNSVIESIWAQVPILGWPMLAEQPLNAKMVQDVLNIGLRIPITDGVVGWETVMVMVRELIQGQKAEEMELKVKEYGEAARKAVMEGGSSWRSLETLINEVCTNK